VEKSDVRSRNVLLAVLFFGVLMGALDIAIVGPALPAIKKTFLLDDRNLAWVISIYVLFNLIGTPLAAKLSDTFGRRWVYVADVALFALGSLMLALSPSFPLLLLGRSVQGFGAGGIFPVASAVIGDTFPAEKRGGALGLIGAVFGLAFIIGPLVGGLLLPFGWQWLFLINLPIAIALIIMAILFVPQERRKAAARFDWLGMSVLALLLACLAYGINHIDASNALKTLLSFKVWPFILASLALVPLFVFIEGRAVDPVFRLGLFTKRQVVLASLITVGSALAEAGLVFIPILATHSLKLSQSQSSFMLFPMVLSMTLASPLIGRLLDRIGSKVVVLSGTVLLSAGMALLGLFSSVLSLFIVSGVMMGFGFSALLGAPMRYIMLAEAPPKDRAAAQAILFAGGNIGMLVGGVLLGAVAASLGGGQKGYGSNYLMLSGLGVVLLILALFLKSRVREREGHAKENALSPSPSADFEKSRDDIPV
jgi:EmrB/QacA subfamily drug resistance transporter